MGSFHQSKRSDNKWEFNVFCLFLRAVVNMPIQTLIIPQWLLLRKMIMSQLELGPSMSRSKQYMPRKFAEMSSKFRFGQEFVEKLGISSNFVEFRRQVFVLLLHNTVQCTTQADLEIWTLSEDKDELLFDKITTMKNHPTQDLLLPKWTRILRTMGNEF